MSLKISLQYYLYTPFLITPLPIPLPSTPEMAPNEDQQPYLMGRSIITGAPLLFPLRQQELISSKLDKLELESGGKEEVRFSTAIYQILERVENKVSIGR